MYLAVLGLSISIWYSMLFDGIRGGLSPLSSNRTQGPQHWKCRVAPTGPAGQPQD